MKQQITYKELKQLFINFLKENKALKQYKVNLIEQKSNLFTEYINYIDFFTIGNIKMCIVYEEFNEFINNSFTWAKTLQGHKFWETLDKKWRQTTKKYSYRIIDINKVYGPHT